MKIKSKNMFNFKTQNSIGKKGERIFLQQYPDAQRVEDNSFDFLIKGKKVELKTDTYNMNSSPNFFMEKHGNDKTMKLGGPWKAEKDGADYFVYFFIKNGVFFWFKVKELVKFLDKYILENNLHRYIIDNRTYSSIGYLIKRDDLKELFLKVDEI